MFLLCQTISYRIPVSQRCLRNVFQMKPFHSRSRLDQNSTKKGVRSVPGLDPQGNCWSILALRRGWLFLVPFFMCDVGCMDRFILVSPKLMIAFNMIDRRLSCLVIKLESDGKLTSCSVFFHRLELRLLLSWRRS